LPALRTEETAGESWADNGEVVVVDDLAAAATVADDYAPEHLQVMTDEPRPVHAAGGLDVGGRSGRGRAE